ncbi:MAG: DUF5668 domain-containing protein [bacterium]
MFVGYALIAFGLGFLLRYTGILDDTFWHIIWPLLLIAFGLSLITKRYAHIPFFDRDR